jgi:transposase
MNQSETSRQTSSKPVPTERSEVGGGSRDASPLSASSRAARTSSEVTAKATRRRFSAAYKLRVIRLADECKAPGELGSLLRREGLYSSLLSAWRKQRDEGTLQGLEPKRRGPVPQPDTRLTKENDRLRKQVERLERKLDQAETIIEFQKKLSKLLGLSEEADAISENGSSRERRG